MLLALMLACSTEEPNPAPAEPPAAPPPEPPPAAPAATVLELDDLGGGGGAPAGMNFIVPAGSDAELVPGTVGDGATGFRMTVRAPGDALACTQPVDVNGTLGIRARLALSEVRTGGQPWMGLNLEVRARDASGALVSPPGARYVLVRNLTAPLGWGDVDGTAAIPPGAVRAEVCLRFVGATGTVEVDRIELHGTPMSATAGGTRWELDQPGGENGAPLGASFLVPPGTPGAETFAGDLGGARGYRLAVRKPSNALVCTEPFPVAGTMRGRGRVRLTEAQAGGGAYSGFTAEVRSYDAAGALVSPPGSQFIPLQVWKVPGAWAEFEVPFTAPERAATARLCTRFVESTGVAEVDWLGVAGAEDAVAEGRP